MLLDMIFKAIKGSIKNTYIRKLRLHCTKYEWRYDEWIIRNDGTTMIYLIFKRINPATRIFFSNLKYEIDKATLNSTPTRSEERRVEEYKYWKFYFGPDNRSLKMCLPYPRVVLFYL